MAIAKISYGRRSFIQKSSLISGGLMIGFPWLASCEMSAVKVNALPKEWFELNGFLKIADNGLITIMSPNPEIGQNIKTSMPMIVAEELDALWDNVIVEQAPLNTAIFKRQLAGGSQSIRQGWESLRMAGATARYMLIEAAAKVWNVATAEISTNAGMLLHESSGKKAGYGDMASAAADIEVPKSIALKDIEDFKIIGSSRKNVDGKKIVTGKPLFGLDYKKEGMLIAMIVHPPAFGQQLKSINAKKVENMPGIKAVFSIETQLEDYTKQWCDTDSFNQIAVVLGKTTWQVMQAKKALEVQWENAPEKNEKINGWSEAYTAKVPFGLESTADHQQKMIAMDSRQAKTERQDGNPKAMFKKAAKIIERTYTCPYLAHNTMEPMNFFADVTDEKATLVGPIQTPEAMEKSVASRLGLPLEKVDIQMTRMGGGFGRRLYGHFLTEAAVISKTVKAPIKLIYTREDDMSQGIYRPTYRAIYRAALDKDNNLIAFHVKAGGIPESPLAANRFPAGAVDHYLAESWELESNISTGAFRAPRSNFIAGAEQAFLDEVAELAGKDPIQFRLDLLQRAQDNPVGKNNDYDAARYAGVLKLVREKANWQTKQEGLHRGVSAYFCHNSYVANVLDMVIENGKPVVDKIYCTVDCGIVINPDAAKNLSEGGLIDGIGHALYSAMSFKEGVPEQQNFDTYRLIRHSEAPKSIQVDFVQNQIAPTGLGEPTFPPVIGALANALYRATGRRYYNQPFVTDKPLVG